MPELIKEDGSGLAGANSYASVADADTYTGARPHTSTTWSAKTEDQKKQFLIMATLMIDSLFIFGGYKANLIQGLQWPRIECPNPDYPRGSWRNPLLGFSSGYFAPNEIPAILVKATCEQAFQLAVGDRTGGAANAGLKEFEIAEAIRVVFDTATEQNPPIPSLVQAMLSRLGEYKSSRGGQARLIRS